MEQNMNNEKIAVSINCPVFNHEKYLRRCLDSLLMQKTNFKYEILVHDDASTDGSTDIIREYELKYPDLIKPIYQTVNQYSQGVKIGWSFQVPRARGKYYAFCEGDDFWIDEYKLQKQYDIMEKHSAAMCVHKVECVSENGDKTGKSYPKEDVTVTENEIITSDKVLEYLEVENVYPFQTSSFFVKTSIMRECVEIKPKFMTLTNAGSINLMIYCATKGDFVYLDNIMSAYRTNSIGSWSESQRNPENRIRHLENWIKTKQAVNEFLEYRYSKHIEQQILGYEFEIYKLKQDYKRCLNSKYKHILEKMSWKEKMYIIMNAQVPGIMRGYKTLRSNLKDICKKIKGVRKKNESIKKCII